MLDATSRSVKRQEGSMRLSPVFTAWNRVAPTNRVQGHAVDNAKLIGARLRLLRIALGYDQTRTFCRKVGISEQAWSNYESGRRRIALDEAMKIVTKTSVSLDYVYRGLESTLPKHLADKLDDLREAEEAATPQASNG